MCDTESKKVLNQYYEFGKRNTLESCDNLYSNLLLNQFKSQYKLFIQIVTTARSMTKNGSHVREKQPLLC